MQKRIAIQGYEGSFHQLAARHFFGKNVEVIPCDTFQQLIRTTESSVDADAGIMAIENSIAGSILPNYNLLHRSNLVITGELYLQIRQNLLVNPGVRLEDLREIHSHPMAIQQCFEFLENHNWKLVETDDTALSAKQVHQHNSKHIAAIASKLAAELFSLEVLVPNIHTLKNNYTRFLVIQRPKVGVEIAGADKASISFHTDHSRGSLAKVLTKIAAAGINLTKLQSFPLPNTNFKYSFHADMEFENLNQFEKVITQIKPMTEQVKIYGVYKTGLWK